MKEEISRLKKIISVIMIYLIITGTFAPSLAFSPDNASGYVSSSDEQQEMPSTVRLLAVKEVNYSAITPLAAGGTPLDVAFIIDVTGSMSDDIAAVKSASIGIINALYERTTDLRIAVVSYRDFCDSCDPTNPAHCNVYDFSGDISSVKSHINSLSATGGADWAEDMPEAIYRAGGLSWRTDATRVAILMADAPPHCPGDVGDRGCCPSPPPYKDFTVWTSNLAGKGVTVYTVRCESRDYNACGISGVFQWIAETTGGVSLYIAHAGELPDIIMGMFKLKVSVTTDKSTYESSEPVIIRATVQEETEGGLVPVTGASVTTSITKPDTTKESLTLYDDGLHNDGIKDDGVYGNTFTDTVSGGDYTVSVVAMKAGVSGTSSTTFTVTPPVLWEILEEEGEFYNATLTKMDEINEKGAEVTILIPNKL